MTSSDGSTDVTPAEPSTAEPATVDAAPAPPEPVPVPERVTFESVRAHFSGTGREYFQIWIVNLLLTVVTLGVYSAWAKVRRLQYFYRHTRIAGAGFDYHGNPIAILKGRLVAAALFAAYTFATNVSPWYTLVVMGVIALNLPWMLAKSLRFRLHNTSYRGLRFRFLGSMRSAYWVFLGLPLLSVLLWLVPFTHHRIKRYHHGQAAYGRTRFAFKAPVAEFYVTYVGAAGIVIGFMVILFVVMIAAVAIAVGTGLMERGNDDPRGPLILAAVIMPVYVMGFIAVQAYFRARLQRVIWAHTTLDRHSFAFTVEPMRLFWIMLTNLLATIATLGLFRPFAQVRLAKYLADSFILHQRSSFDELTAAEGDEVTALGEEAADIFDFDFSL